MMAGKGGYQKPGNPAPVSGMGSLSQRTDGGPADKQRLRYVANLPYGEGQEFMDIQGGAPMEAAPATSPAPARQQVQQAAAATPRDFNILNAQDALPVTAGIDMGPGPGAEAIAAFANPVSQLALASALQPLLEHDTTGDVRFLYNLAVNRGW